MIRSFADLQVFQKSYSLALEIFEETKSFPKEEKYSLTDQLRRSSRSIAANIAEGWGKRRFENVFKRHLTDAIGSVKETMVWMQFAKDFGYLREEKFRKLSRDCDEVDKMLFALLRNWRTFGR